MTTDLPTFQLDDLRPIDLDDLDTPWADEPDVTGDEVDKTRKLSSDRIHSRFATARTCQDFRSNPDAYAHLARLPKIGESLHGVISGKYALWELVPVIIERTGEPIDELHLATLSFSKNNAADILALIDAGKIRKLSLLVSHYFKSTSRPIYDALIPQLIERGQKVLAMRTHCKIILAATPDGGKYVAESSANLRSCVNIEQFVFTHCADLYAFHRGWIDEVLNTGDEVKST